MQYNAFIWLIKKNNYFINLNLFQFKKNNIYYLLLFFIYNLGVKLEYIEGIKDENDNLIYFLFFTKNKTYEILITDDKYEFNH